MQPFAIRNEVLRNKFLPDSELARVHTLNPKLKRNYEQYCPTCDKQGSYVLRGTEYPCDCQLQHQLATHYTAAGIGDLYQRYSWDDLRPDRAPELRSAASDYLTYASGHVKQGQGLVMLGFFGRGKSLTGSLLLKSLMWQGYSCYFTTFTNMIEMFTDGWKDKDDKKYFAKKLKGSDVVMIDDIGKEFTTKSGLAESTFDDVLRHRHHNNMPTIITSNMKEKELKNGYGGAVFSLLLGSSYLIDLTYANDFERREDEDYRSTANQEKMQYARNNWVRPII